MEMNKAGVLEKGFRVLETMADASGPLRLKELSEKVQLNKATLHRILHVLTELGYVAQESESSKYLLTPQLAFLGRKSYYDELIERVLPFMEHLNRKFDETVNLGVLEGAYVYYLHFVETSQALRWTVKPGARDPFYSTSLGRASAAFLPKKLRDELVSRAVFKPRTPNTVSTKAQLTAILEEVCARGWATDEQENDVGVTCFGVPLMKDGHPIASMSISLPQSRLTPALREQIVEELLRVKEEASGCGVTPIGTHR